MTSEDYFSVIPWPAFGIVCSLCFVIGIALGTYLERRRVARRAQSADPTLGTRKAPTMNETKRRFRSPLNFGVDYLQSRPPLSAAYQRVSLIVAFAGIAFGGIAVVGVVALTWQRTGDAETRINDNQHNAVISCQNANESRKASLALWTFLFDTSLKSNPDMPAQQRRNIRDIRVWIAKLYAPRDCTDLSKKYEIPPPPVIRPIARSS